MMNQEAADKVKSILEVLATGSSIPAHDAGFLKARRDYLTDEQLALLKKAEVTPDPEPAPAEVDEEAEEEVDPKPKKEKKPKA